MPAQRPSLWYVQGTARRLHVDGSPDLRKTQFSSEGLKNLIGLARTFESFVLDDGWRKLRGGQSYVKYSEIYKFVNCPIDEIKPVFKVV